MWNRKAVIILSAFTLFVGITGCQRQAEQRVSMADVAEELGPRQQSWGAELLISNDGIRRLVLHAPVLQEFVRGDTMFTMLRIDEENPVGRVRAFVYNIEGEQTAEIEADQIQLFNEEDRIEATGKVVVTTNEDRKLETERLLWWESDSKLLAPGFVTLTAPNETIQGYELDSDEKLENYTLGQVTGQILVDE